MWVADAVLGTVLVGWFASLAVGVVRMALDGYRGYTVAGGRMIRWVSSWTCIECGETTACPRKGAGLKCRRCGSPRDASVTFWHEQSKLPRKQRHPPGVPRRAKAAALRSAPTGRR